MVKIAHCAGDDYAGGREQRRRRCSAGKLFPFSCCAQRHKNMEKGGPTKMVAAHTTTQTPLPSLHSLFSSPIEGLAWFFAPFFCDFLPITLRARTDPRRTEGGLSKLIIVEYFVAASRAESSWRRDLRCGLSLSLCLYLI